MTVGQLSVERGDGAEPSVEARNNHPSEVRRRRELNGARPPNYGKQR
eukprot:COSAG01_NODE_4039_length_5406_cov_1.715980_6_plen_47_part_00